MTIHTEFMAEAFKVKAFRFLNKPIKVSDLEETLRELEKEMFLDRKLIVIDYGSEILLNVADILYIEARKNKTIIYTLDNVFETNCTLKYWKQKLDANDFIQIHKSYIVSLRHIKAFDVDCVWLHASKISVPVSRRNISLVKKRYRDYNLIVYFHIYRRYGIWNDDY